MKDFYVQLMSNASTVEFPANKANSFKNRLPTPLQFREPGWKVGLANLSLPEAPRRMKLNDPFLFRIQWVELVDPDRNLLRVTCGCDGVRFSDTPRMEPNSSTLYEIDI